MADIPISIFSVPTKTRAEPLSALLSILMHSVVAAFLIFILFPAPRIKPPYLAEKYSVRMLLIHSPQPRVFRPEDGERSNPYPSDLLHQVSLNGTQQNSAPRLAKALTPSQFVIQMDSASPIELPQDLPIPTVLLVSQVDLPNQKIASPPLPAPANADVKPVFQLPNHEQNVSDIALASTELSTSDSTLQASTTSPLRLQGAKLEKRLPQTPSLSTSPSTPPTVMVFSDVQLRDGTVALPVAAQKSSVAPGKDDQAIPSHSFALNDEKAVSANGNSGSGAPSQGIPVKRLTLPTDGRFSMVLVGNSLDEQYPEIAGIWGGRLAYTVYLHVGLAKNWILQYSLPRADQAPGTGASGRLDAPWPTDIIVPNFPPGYSNSDALIVHGMLNKSGHFDQLKVVFPPQFAEASFVLDLLQRWIFRPASTNVQVTDVDVLLIIPEVDD